MSEARADKKLIIVMMRKESILESWMRDASTFVTVVALIILGVALESPAMQWTGAVVAFLAIAVSASGKMKARTFDLDGAQAELDKLRAESSQSPHPSPARS